MSDRAAHLARFPCEGGAVFRMADDGGVAGAEMLRVIKERFPGITQAEIERGIRIAVEVVMTDGRRA